MKATRKKTKVIGVEEYINKDGVIVPMQVISIEDKDANFHKIWLGHIIHSLDLIGNQKIRLANFLLDNMDRENKIIMTLRQMAEKSNISLETVRTTIKTLQESNFIRKINQGAYQINPEIIFKGGTNERMNVLIKYQKTEAEENSPKVSAFQEVTATKEEPIPEPTQEQEQSQKDKCPECGSVLEVKKGKYGEFLGCPNYKKCGYKGKKVSA